MNRYLFTLTTLLCLFVHLQVHAQSPAAFNYQAVVRDASGNVLPNQAVSFRMNVRASSATGTTVYSETHATTTNSLGLVNLQIGQGSVVSGTFSTIDWGNDSHYLEIELDPAGGSNFTGLGTQQLISVPYALHATTVENDAVDDADADPNNELQSLSLVGDTLTISNGNSVQLPQVVDTDDQNLSISNDSLIIQDGNSVDLSPYLDNTDDQNLSISNDSLIIQDGNAVDLSPYLDNTDAQVISISNDTVFLSNGGFAILPPQTVDTDDQNLSISNDSLIIQDGNAVDLSPYLDNTDAQVISISNDTVFLSNGGFAILPPQTVDTDDQNLSISNDSLIIQDGNAVDLSPYLDNTDAQVISISNDTVFLSNGGFAILPPQTADTDDQNLSISNDSLIIQDGNAVDLSPYLDNTDAQVISISNDTVFLSNGGFAVLPTPPADGDWGFNGNDIYKLNSGNVGIGTQNPGVRLEVFGGSVGIRRSNNSFPSRYLFRNLGGEYNWKIEHKGGTGTDAFVIAGGNTANNAQNLTERLRIDEFGNVGINVSNISARLQVQGTIRSSGIGLNGDYIETFHGGANAALNWAGTGNLDFRYQSNDRMTLTQNGNLGIGTTTPDSKLEVTGYEISLERPNNSNSSRFLFRNQLGNYSWKIENLGGTGSDPLVIAGGNPNNNPSALNERLRIDPNGNVGVNLDNIGAKFQVQGDIRSSAIGQNADYVEMFHGGLNAYFNWNGTGNLDFRYQTVEQMTLTQNGRLGIGTTNPATRLHVAGKIRMADGSQVAGYIPVSDANGTMNWTDPNVVFQDNQTLSINNDSLIIVDGNAVDLSPYMDNTDAQVISISNDTVFLSNGGFAILPPEQTLSRSGNQVSMSNGGGSVSISPNLINAIAPTLVTIDGGTPGTYANVPNPALSIEGNSTYLVWLTFRFQISGGSGSDQVGFRLAAQSGSCSDDFSSILVDLDSYREGRGNWRLVSFHRVITTTNNSSCGYTLRLQVDKSGTDDIMLVDDVQISAIKVD